MSEKFDTSWKFRRKEILLDVKLTGTCPPADTIHCFYMAIIRQLPLLNNVGSTSQSELKTTCPAGGRHFCYIKIRVGSKDMTILHNPLIK